MADEVLRMEAEVRDKFSGPLKALRAQLLDTARQGADHGETLAKGMNKAETAVRATARTAQTVLNPALAAVGVTGIGAGVAVAGIANALGSLTGKLSGLGQLSRETGMAADQLRVFQSLAGKFGISTDASSAAAQTFARNMRDIRRGIGETMGFLQGQNPVVATFALKLKGSKNNDEARKLTEDFLEQIPDPQDRKKFAERMFGSEEFGRLGDRHLGSIAKLRESMQQKMGPLAPGAVESAERYERALSSLRGSMQKTGEAIAMELVAPAERFATWADDLVSGKRGDVTKGLREGIRGIKTELEAINWKQFGDDSIVILNETTALAGKTAAAFRTIAETIRELRKGEYSQAARGADGASGPLARYLAPKVGDDEIAAQEEVDLLRKQLKEPMVDFESGTPIDLSFQDDARRKQLGEAEARLKALKDRTPEQRQRDFEATDRLRKSVDSLNDTIKGQGKDATAQKSSVEGDGLFPGARIQTAGFTRLRGPGDVGSVARLPGIGNGAPGAFLGGRSFGGGRFNGLGSEVPPADRPAGIGSGAPRLSPAPMTPPGGGAPTGSDAGNLTALIDREARAAGIDPRIMQGIRAGESGKRHNRSNPDGAYDRKDDAIESSWGPFQLNRRRGLGTEFERETGLDVRDRRTIPDQVRWVARYIAKHGRKGLRHWMGYRGDRDADPRWGDSGYVPSGASAGRLPGMEAPAGGDADFFPNGAPRILRPNSMRDAPGITMAESDRVRANRSAMLRRPDILADAGDERRKAGLHDEEVERRAVRDAAIGFRAISRRAEDRLTAAAGRAGVAAAPKIDGSSVTVNVNKAGAETTASVSTEGPAFRDVQMRRGQTMEKAGGS